MKKFTKFISVLAILWAIIFFVVQLLLMLDYFDVCEKARIDVDTDTLFNFILLMVLCVIILGFGVIGLTRFDNSSEESRNKEVDPVVINLQNKLNEKYNGQFIFDYKATNWLILYLKRKVGIDNILNSSNVDGFIQYCKQNQIKNITYKHIYNYFQYR